MHPTGLVKPDDADAKIKFLAAEVRPGRDLGGPGTWVGAGTPGGEMRRCCGGFFVTKSLGVCENEQIFDVDLPTENMVIFHSYVKLPEGRWVCSV